MKQSQEEKPPGEGSLTRRDFLLRLGYASALALDNSFEIVFVQDKTMAGVHDATSAAAALELAARLQSGLKGQP